MTPLPLYSSDTASSCSSTPRSMPMCQVQLNSTDFKSRASAAGVYGGGPSGGGNCAAAVNVKPIANTTPSARLDVTVPCRRTMLLPESLVAAAAARDLDLALVGQRD